MTPRSYKALLASAAALAGLVLAGLALQEADDAKPVSEVVERLAGLWGGALSWEGDPVPQPHEAQLLHLDSGKAQRLLGWRPRLDLKQALAWTVDWYKACARGDDMHAATLAQVARYQQAEVAV